MNWFEKLLKLKHQCKFCKKEIWVHEWFCSDRCSSLWLLDSNDKDEE